MPQIRHLVNGQPQFPPHHPVRLWVSGLGLEGVEVNSE